MRYLKQTVNGILRRGERSGYVAECFEIAVVTQGKTIDATLKNLQNAVALHLDGEDPTQFELRERPTLIVTMELEPAHA